MAGFRSLYIALPRLVEVVKLKPLSARTEVLSLSLSLHTDIMSRLYLHTWAAWLYLQKRKLAKQE